MSNFEPVIDQCDQGHHFAKLPDHPKNAMLNSACPICMAAGLELARTDLIKTNVFFLAAIEQHPELHEYFYSARRAVFGDLVSLKQFSGLVMPAQGLLKDYLEEESRRYLSQPKVIKELLDGLKDAKNKLS